jgi:hypothetical protein
MVIKMMVRRRLQLTDPQVALLRFFAGEQGPPPSTRPKTYDVLCAEGLIKANPSGSRYVITDFGRWVLAEVTALQACTTRCSAGTGRES